MNDIAHSLITPAVTLPADLIKLTREGLSADVAWDLKNRYDLSEKELLAILGTSRRTFQRRTVLNTVESDRLIRFSSILRLAEDLFGEPDAVRVWLHASNKALGGVSPLSVLDTDAGTRQVETVLGRLMHGVYS